MATQAAQVITPNMFQLSGKELHIIFVTRGIDGRPNLTYQDSSRTLQFTGNEIRSVETELGRVVSVSIRRTVDSGSTTFSLLIPRVNLVGSAAVPIRTEGITTLHKFSIIPAFNQGQLDFYTVTRLSGFASLVLFPIHPEVIPEVAPEVRPEVVTEVAPEVKPEVVTEVAPEVRPEVRPEVVTEVAPEVKPEVVTEVAPEVRPEVRPEVITEVAPETRPEERGGRTPTVRRQGPSSGASRPRPEVITEVAPEIRPSETEDK
jgi:hypothetical protein